MHYYGGFRHYQDTIVHLYTECPEGRLVAIAKQELVNVQDPETMQGLERCGWCFGKAEGDDAEQSSGAGRKGMSDR